MRRFIPLLFFIILLSVLVGAIVYLSTQMKAFFNIGSSVLWISTFSLLLVFMIGGLLRFSNSKQAIGSLLYKVAAFLMGFLLYFLMVVLLVDLANIFIKGSPLVSGVFSISITLTTILFGFRNSFNIRITRHTVKIKTLKKPLKIAHLSDIHIGHFRGERFLQQIVSKTNREAPDLIVITGDLFDGKIRLKESVLKPLKSLYAPVVFVNGNHDVYSGLAEVYKILEKTGVKALRNEIFVFKGIQIIGLNHMRADDGPAGMHASGGSNIKDTLAGLNIDPELPSILLHHSPDGMVYANQHGLDLYLSGHTHGGQQFPVTLINEILFKFNRGLRTYKDSKIIVSEGIGTFGPPIRIGTKSEIIIIELS